MNDGARLVLVVASSREDRRVLFDALDGMQAGEILSARNLIQARALLEKSAQPALAILDFEHAPTASRVLCGELEAVPVIGLFGARFDARNAGERLKGCSNIRTWLRIPVDAVDAGMRIREALNARSPSDGEGTAFGVSPSLPEIGATATLRILADLLQPARDAAGLPGLLQRAMHALGLDFLIVAERDKPGSPLTTLARVDRLSMIDEPDLLAQAFAQRALDGEPVVCAGEVMLPEAKAYLHATGYVRCALLPLFNAHRDVLGVMACASRRADAPPLVWQPMLEIVAARFAGLLELRAERGHSRDRALLDGLTGLPNRLLFNDRLESALHDARRTGEVFAVLFVDLDRFKGINDSLGHNVGDQVLVAVAEKLRRAVRASDTVARYAGDEFTLILRHANNRADAARVAAKLLASMQSPLTLDNGSELHVTVSIGLSVYPDDATDTDGLVKHADLAMYSAKGEGRNGVKTFGNAPEDTHRQHLEMESRLREAEANAELSVHYQPQIDIASGDIVVVEALVRWHHPVLGMLSPAFFIPLAEETGLIISIGEWVLRQACAEVAGWRDATGRPLRLAVNLSALQWMQPNLVPMIRAVCHDSGLAPDVLDLETPEGVLNNPPTELATTAQMLRRIGCQIVIDDAGAARADPDHELLPVDAVKIDHSFIRNIGSDPDDELVVTSIIDTARRRHVRTVAEGVETRRQLEFLRERSCDAAQGYLFCRPLPAAELTRQLLRPMRMQGGGA